MMHQNKLVVVIKTNGKILREHGENVYIPFNSEYTVLIKNLNSVRCLVNVEIDGEDIAEGTSFIVPANGSIDIERFIKNGNRDVGQRFKFIERTAKIEEYRGIGAEDGLIRIQYEFERVPFPSTYTTVPNTWTEKYSGGYRAFGGTAADEMLKSNVNHSSILGSLPTGFAASATSVSCSTAKQEFVNLVNDTGITVGGSISEQKFTEGLWFPTDGTKHIMVLKILGERGQTAVVAPVTTKTKQKCPTCGHMNKSSSKFCSECGTGLVEPQQRYAVR